MDNIYDNSYTVIRLDLQEILMKLCSLIVISLAVSNQTIFVRSRKLSSNHMWYICNLSSHSKH